MVVTDTAGRASRASEHPGHDSHRAVRGLHTCGDTAYWWEDTTAGAVALCGDVATATVEPMPLPPVPDGMVVLARYPGPLATVVLTGHPGGDYGWLGDPVSGDTVLVRRPSVVWLREPGSTTPVLLYPRFPLGSTLSDPPVDGMQLALHHVGERFADDRVVLYELPPGGLVSLEATAEDTAALVRTVHAGSVAFDLLHLDPAAAVGHRMTRLDVAADARTRIALGHGRWWRGTALGTPRAALYATPPGTLANDRAVRVDLPEGTALTTFWATRDQVILRTLRGRSEQLVSVDNATLTWQVLGADASADRFPEVAASPADTCAVWLRVGLPGGAPYARLEILSDGHREPRLLRRFGWPASLCPVDVAYRAHDGARLPLQVSGDTGLAVLLDHGGMTALANAPLERILERLAFDGQITIVRAVTRSPVPAYRVPAGERGYNDLLAAAEWWHEHRDGGAGIIVLGHSMGAVGAARAVLLRPELFRAAVLRFPVTDLIDFPNLGIGRHWTPMLGDPVRPAHRAALARLSPLHMPLPERSLPEVLVQVGRHDTRADPRHGRRFAARLAPMGAVQVREYAVGHVESVAYPESRRAVRDVTHFVRRHARTEPVVERGMR